MHKTRALSLASILGVEDLELHINDRSKIMLMKLHFLSADPLFLLLLIFPQWSVSYPVMIMMVIK